MGFGLAWQAVSFKKNFFRSGSNQLISAAKTFQQCGRLTIVVFKCAQVLISPSMFWGGVDHVPERSHHSLLSVFMFLRSRKRVVNLVQQAAVNEYCNRLIKYWCATAILSDRSKRFCHVSGATISRNERRLSFLPDVEYGGWADPPSPWFWPDATSRLSGEPWASKLGAFS